MFIIHVHYSCPLFLLIIHVHYSCSLFMFIIHVHYSSSIFMFIFIIFFCLTLILLRLFQQHYCYNVTGQSQESEGSYKPARIEKVHSKLHSFQAWLCTLTATHLTLIYVCTYIRLNEPLGCLIKQAGIIIHTILNMWETPGIEPVTSSLASVYQTSSSTTRAIPPHYQGHPKYSSYRGLN